MKVKYEVKIIAWEDGISRSYNSIDFDMEAAESIHEDRKANTVRILTIAKKLAKVERKAAEYDL